MRSLVILEIKKGGKIVIGLFHYEILSLYQLNSRKKSSNEQYLK